MTIHEGKGPHVVSLYSFPVATHTDTGGANGLALQSAFTHSGGPHYKASYSVPATFVGIWDLGVFMNTMISWVGQGQMSLEFFFFFPLY